MIFSTSCILLYFMLSIFVAGVLSYRIKNDVAVTSPMVMCGVVQQVSSRCSLEDIKLLSFEKIPK